MTFVLEDALYDFLDEALAPFTSEQAAQAIYAKDSMGSRRLIEETGELIAKLKLAFPSGRGTWISRRACFEGKSFALSPSRLEIQNGILIPGHRCIPFANPILLPHELSFTFEGTAVPVSTTEGAPADFYPYFDLLGEEYAPQYLAKDNELNEEAFNADPYEDPPEVSIHTLDMRAIYRATSFVPGDLFAVRCTDWKSGAFELTKVGKSAWKEEELLEWQKTAETGFEKSFELLGPGANTEEQIAFAYWYGGERMRAVPALSLEEFIYEKTDRIETVNYGMETRFWKAGKEIPDSGPWNALSGPADKTEIEEILAQAGLPISEYVIESYVRDGFFRRENSIAAIYHRLVPPSLALNEEEGVYLAQFIEETIEDFGDSYNYFQDKDMGQLRQRAIELHSAVIDLVARISKADVNAAWLPKHAFVSLSQIQIHAANLLEDLDFDESPDERELEGMANSLEAMIDSYDEVKEAIDANLDGFRRSRLSLVREAAGSTRILQAALAGTSVWRRLLVNEETSLTDLHRILQASLGWSGERLHGFVVNGEVYGTESGSGELSEEGTRIADLISQGVTEIRYDYDFGAEWELKISLISGGDEGTTPRCLAGEGAAPPESCGGPLRFRRFLSALKEGKESELALASAELGEGFEPDVFDIADVNRRMAALNIGPKEGGI